MLNSTEGSSSRKKSTEKKNNSEMVIAYFSEMIRNKKVPQKKECEAFIHEKSSSLKWRQVKDIVNAKVQGLKRKDKKSS